MPAIDRHRMNPELRELVVEASLALARLDADRLEELALSCQALNGALAGLSPTRRGAMQLQAREASRDIEVFGRVLDATRNNLEVMNRLRERRRGDLEYAAERAEGWAPWAQAEKCDGNH